MGNTVPQYEVVVTEGMCMPRVTVKSHNVEYAIQKAGLFNPLRTQSCIRLNDEPCDKYAEVKQGDVISVGPIYSGPANWHEARTWDLMVMALENTLFVLNNNPQLVKDDDELLRRTWYALTRCHSRDSAMDEAKKTIDALNKKYHEENDDG